LTTAVIGRLAFVGIIDAVSDLLGERAVGAALRIKGDKGHGGLPSDLSQTAHERGLANCDAVPENLAYAKADMVSDEAGRLTRAWFGPVRQYRRACNTHRRAALTSLERAEYHCRDENLAGPIHGPIVQAPVLQYNPTKLCSQIACSRRIKNPEKKRRPGKPDRLFRSWSDAALALRELGAPAGLGAAVLLALDDARVASKKPSRFTIVRRPGS
jgi:hypothetical protein